MKKKGINWIKLAMFTTAVLTSYEATLVILIYVILSSLIKSSSKD